MYIPDNYDAFLQHDHQQQNELEQLPHCSYCDEPITDEFCYIVNDEPICERCMNSEFRTAVDELI